jgi:hypothetical protein
MARADNEAPPRSAGAVRLEAPPRSAGAVPLLDRIADVRDGLTRIERVVLFQLHKAQRERGGRNVPTAMLYGRVVEHVNISVEELQRTLQRLVGR